MTPSGGRLSAPEGATREHADGRTIRLLALATVGLFAIRALMSLARSGPVLMADEAGYLAHARVLAGGQAFEMGSSPVYRAGYSALLAPVFALDAGPTLTYHLVLLVNAALAASLLPLLYLLLTRSFAVGPVAALPASLAAAAYPSITAFSQIAVAENLLFALTVLWLLAAGALLASRGRRAAHAGLAVGICAAALWTVHGRMVVAVAVTAVLVAVLALRRLISPAAAAVAALATGAGLVAGRLLDDFVVQRNYDGRHGNEISDVLSSLDGAGDLLGLLRNIAGTGWYLLVATFGIAGLVLVVAGPSIARRVRRRESDGASASMAVLLATTAGLIVVSAVWFLDLERADQLVYGRYVEPVVPALLALGIVALGRRPRRLTHAFVLAAIIALTISVAALRSGVEVFGDANRWNVAALPFVTSDLGPAIVLAAGGVAVASAFALVGALRRAPVPAWLCVIALFVPITMFNQIRLVMRAEHDRYPVGWISPREAAERQGDRVGYDVAPDDRFAVKTYQWLLPDTAFALFDSRVAPPPAPVFFSTRSWSRRHPARPATILWRDAARDQVLWRLGTAR